MLRGFSFLLFTRADQKHFVVSLGGVQSLAGGGLFFRSRPSLGFFVIGHGQIQARLGLLSLGLELGALECHQHLILFGNLTLEDQNGFDAAAYLGAETNLLDFDDAGKRTGAAFTPEGPEIIRRAGSTGGQEHDDQKPNRFQGMLRELGVRDDARARMGPANPFYHRERLGKFTWFF